MEPIPIRDGAFLEKDFLAEEQAWAHRMLLKPAQEKWQRQPWADEATALVEAAFEQFAKDHADSNELAPLADRFRELLKKTNEDPLLLELGARALFAEKMDWREGRPLLEKALEQGGLNGALEMVVIYSRWLVANREGIDTDDLENRWLNAIERTLSDGSYDEATHTVLVRHHVLVLNTINFTRPEPLEHYSRTVDASTLPDWVKFTLRGTAEKHLAWVKRSDSWASEVKDEQWKGFAEHLKSARDLLGKASRLRPDRPEAASTMIGVAMGEGMDPTELRAWFDRSVSAQFDYAPAYKALLYAYRPRWSGSHALMLAFGKACAATKRYDTMVPSQLMVAAMAVTEEIYNPHAVFRHREVQQAMVDMSRGYLEGTVSSPPLMRHLRVSDAAMCAFLADDDALAQKALDAAGPRLHRSTRDRLSEMLMHEDFLRAEVAADNGAYGEAIRAAANPAPKTPLSDIHATFMKIDEKGLSSDAAAYLREAKEITGLQEAVNAGGWVDVHFHKHLTAFYQSEEGDWTVNPDGSLICHGTDHPRSRFVLKVPMEPNVEMKGEIAFDIPDSVQRSQFGTGFAPMIHWLPTCTSGVRAMIYYLGGGSACTKAYCDGNESTPDIPFSLREWNTFSIRAADGKLSYDVNGRTMTSGYDMARLGLETESGMLGFSAYRLPVGTQVRVRNVSIRKITAADLGPKTSSQADGGTSLIRAADFDWIWKAGLIGLLALVAIFIPRFMPNREE
ncbi:hypothetical protein [Prosthecobacter sp.]|uniref:hypothetical protein n=1 Tax=Prosthecobacter sp. TaxID=1965333 RepID=UPI001DE994C0|nr:hypothetical protein [Prosthecobacter sp.]MCB1276674.1 hypothetical protein [Prosthecobacter sp.]